MEEIEEKRIVGVRMRMLVGQGGAKTCAAIVTPKAGLDYQFYDPGNNKVLKDHQNIKYGHSDSFEQEGELISSYNIQTEGN